MSRLLHYPLQHAAAPLVLLLLVLLPGAQAQGRAANDASWMPATTTTTLQQAAAAVPMRTGPAPDAADGTGPVGTGPVGKRPGTAAPTADSTAAGNKMQRPPTAAVADPAASATAAVGTSAGAGTSDVRSPARPLSTAAALTTTPPASGQGMKAAAAQAAGLKATAAAANPAGSLHNVLAKNTPLFRSLFTVLDIAPEQIQDSTVGTFFAPSDKAIESFLQSMGMTAKQLAARPELVDLIVSYHFVPGYQVRGSDDVADGTKTLLTGDEQFILNISSSTQPGGQLALSDVQRSRANVVDGPITPQNPAGISVFVIDKVLRSGNYFLTIESALGHSPYWISAKDAISKTNILPQLEGQPLTLLIPDNAAFKPLEGNLSRASTGRLAEILRYHVLPKVRRLPRGFEQGLAATLLKGHTLDMNVTSEMMSDPFSGNKNKTVLVPQLAVTPEVGRPAKVSVYNIYAGPAIMHGIGGVLMPNLPPDPNELPPPKNDPTDRPTPEEGTDTPAEEVGLAGPESEDTPGDDNETEQPPMLQPSRTAGAGTAGTASTASTAGRSSTSSSRIKGVRGTPYSPGASAVTVESGSGRANAGQALGRNATDIARAAAAGSNLPAGSASTTAQAGTLQPTTTPPSGTSAAVPRRPVLRGPTPTTAIDGEAGNRRRLLQLPGEALSAGLLAAKRLLFAERVLQQSSRLSMQFRPQGASATPSGALTSVVRVGAMGELQSFPNGIATNKTMIALTRAAVPEVPKVYVNRYGGFKGGDVLGGCLNCKAWGKQTQ